MKINTLVLLALVASTQAYQLKSIHKQKHACDFVDDKGEEISSSLVDNEESKPIELSNV